LKFKIGDALDGMTGYESGMKAKELAKECDLILESKKFRDYPGARNGLQVTHNKPVKKVGWAVDADIESIRKAGKEKVNFLIVHHGLFWGISVLDRKIRANRILLAKRLGVAIYSSHLPLDAHPQLGNSIGLLRALGLGDSKRKPFGAAMGRAIGWKVEGSRLSLRDLAKRLSGTTGRKAVVLGYGPEVCWRIGIVTGGFGDLDQVIKAGVDTLITGEADYPTEVKASEMGINLILGGHRETEIYGVRSLAQMAKLILE
jgi:dinuclear metal center YbgI/SA1388 family protein